MKDLQNQHFSHHHILNSLKLQQGDEIKCDACEQDITEPFHGCIKCNFFLHEKCLNTPRSLDHPSHPTHPLTLHQTPTYSSRSFSCDACGSVGNGFTLCCAHCEFDVHLHCANLPTSVLIDKHPHQLKLIFDSPYTDPNTVITCDVCLSRMNPHHWAYYCAGCDFGSHLDCVNGNPKKGKEKLKKPAEAETRASSATSETYQQGHYSPSVEDINAISRAEEEIYAAAVKARLESQGRRAALDLLDPPGRKYYSYI